MNSVKLDQDIIYNYLLWFSCDNRNKHLPHLCKSAALVAYDIYQSSSSLGSRIMDAENYIIAYDQPWG
jgi:hypothetical protein